MASTEAATNCCSKIEDSIMSSLGPEEESKQKALEPATPILHNKKSIDKILRKAET